MSNFIRRIIAGFKADPSELEGMVIKRDLQRILDDLQTSMLVDTDVAIKRLGVVLGESPAISFTVAGYHEIFPRMRSDIEPHINQKFNDRTEPPYKLEELRKIIVREGFAELWWKFLFVYWVDVVYFNGSRLKLMQKIANGLTGRKGTWLHVDMDIFWLHFLAYNDPRHVGYRKVRYRSHMEMIAPHTAFNGAMVFLQEDGVVYSGNGGRWTPYEIAEDIRQWMVDALNKKTSQS